MAVYKVTFTPTGPYFFGNEKTFGYPGQTVGGKLNNRYFIRGEALPSQTTLLGALRYLLLPLKGYSNLDEQENIDAVGKESYRIDAGELQDFGRIRSLSPLFLTKGKEIFVPTPFDHNCDEPGYTEVKENGKPERIDSYTPFQNYTELTTPDGEKLYTEDFSVKEGVTDSFVSLTDLHLEDDLFASEVRVGIMRRSTEEGFFKKEYRVLKNGYSFAVFAEIDGDSLDGRCETAALGQGKVPFLVRFEACADGEGDLAAMAEKELAKAKHPQPTYYCLGDLFLDTVDYDEFYAGRLRFAVTKTKDFRNFRTQKGGRIEKSTELYRHIRAGSVFLPADGAGDLVSLLAEQTVNQKNGKQIGWNRIIKIGG